MLAALENGVNGGKWFSLVDKVWSPANLRASWEKVKANAGGSGVDGQSVQSYAARLEEELASVSVWLRTNRYVPQPVRRVWIPKPGSVEKRPLGIPAVRDRVVQGALRQVVEPIFEHIFAAHSYGFRPGRGCKDALRRIDALLKNGYNWVVDADLKSYFDTIPHDPLMARVEEQIADGRVLALIRGYLNQGVMDGLTAWTPESGTPQGAVISPLLANLYLNPLDHLMAAKGCEMVRYADDFVILCRTREEAESALSLVGEWVTQAGLMLHPEKTRIVNETEGLRACRVNARHVKNVPGRPKTDARDCQWLQKLHASGLLTASFVPDASTRQLRGLLRHRDRLTRLQSQHILRMQNALREMNVHLDAVVTDIMGVTGLRILKALMQGRRDFEVIAQECRHPLIKATPEQIAAAIDGTYTPDSMFVLEQELEAYDFTGTQVAKLDVQLERLLQLATAGRPVLALPDQGLTGRAKRQGDAPAFNIQQYLYQITGVDLTRIPGIGANASLILLSEIGTDMSRWRSSDAFCSWLGICPNLEKSAGNIHGSRPRRTCSHAKHILRLCATSLKNHHEHLGAFFRRIRARSGTPAAITATAHKRARIIFAMLAGKKPYNELGRISRYSTRGPRATTTLSAINTTTNQRTLPVNLPLFHRRGFPTAADTHSIRLPPSST